MRLVLSPAAVEDIQSIAEYTLETWGQEQQERSIDGLWQKLEAIRNPPATGKTRSEFLQNCRSVRHGKHIVFFRHVEFGLDVVPDRAILVKACGH